jgi:hypothetical protein
LSNIDKIWYNGGKKWGTEDRKGNKTVRGKVTTTCTEDGQKQIAKASTTV